MNPKMNMKLELNMASLKALVPVLQKAQPYLFALVIVGAFGYTAYIINAALNVEAAESQTSIKALPKITFDKKTMESLKNRDKVDSNVPLDLGGANPF
jgi:hypothetical protein